MKTPKLNRGRRGFTIIELLVVVMIVVIMATVILPGLRPAHSGGQRPNCSNNLKQIALSFLTWKIDNDDRLPMQVPVNQGGTMELTNGSFTFIHFAVMSNELSTPLILHCPADSKRVSSADFRLFNNSNLSYFVGLDATPAMPQSILAGDRNLKNGTSLTNQILFLATNRPARWTHELHHFKGNIALSDGSVQQFSSSRLNQGSMSGRLAMP